MKPAISFGLAVTLAGAAATVPSSSLPVAAAAPPTVPPDAVADFVLPADWTVLVDDTNTISVAVPNTWTDVDTAPDEHPDGTLLARIGASPDLDVFVATFDAPGVLFRAIPYTDDHDAVIAEYGLDKQCRAYDVQPYDDGAFAGTRAVSTSCGATGAPQWHEIVAGPASRSFTLIVQVQITGEHESAVLENVVRSFNFTPEGGAAPGPVPPSPPESVPLDSGRVVR